MANFSALKTAIQNAIKQNGNEEITGDVLQQILLSIVSTMGDGAINTIEQNLSNEATTRQGVDTQLQNAINAIKANIDNGYVYAGIATPSSTPVSGKVFYIATAAGTYTNFGGQVLTQGINILRYNGSAWSNQQLIGIDDVPTAGSNSLVKSGGVQNELALGAVYDVSAKNPTAGPNNDGKWESLAALLSDANLNTLIPTAYRKGGMSIKFVHTYDNKYVQYRLMSTAWSTIVTDWQGVENIADIRIPCNFQGYININTFDSQIEFKYNTDISVSLYAYTKNGLIAIPLTSQNDTISYSSLTGYLKTLVVNEQENGFEIIPYNETAGRCVITTFVITNGVFKQVCYSSLPYTVNNAQKHFMVGSAYTGYLNFNNKTRKIEFKGSSSSSSIYYSVISDLASSDSYNTIIPPQTIDYPSNGGYLYAITIDGTEFRVESYVNAIKSKRLILCTFSFFATASSNNPVTNVHFCGIDYKIDNGIIGQMLYSDNTTLHFANSVGKVFFKTPYYRTTNDKAHFKYEKYTYVYNISSNHSVSYPASNERNRFMAFCFDNSNSSVVWTTIDESKYYYVIALVEFDSNLEKIVDVNTNIKHRIGFEKTNKNVLFGSLVNYGLNETGLSTQRNDRASQDTSLTIPQKKGLLRFHFCDPDLVVGIRNGNQAGNLSHNDFWFFDGSEFSFHDDSIYYRLSFALTTKENRYEYADISTEYVKSLFEGGDAIIEYITEEDNCVNRNNGAEPYVKAAMMKRGLTANILNANPVLVHITDVHGDIYRMVNAVEYADYLMADTILATGDIMAYSVTNGFNALKQVLLNSNVPVCFCRGNHETYGNSNASFDVFSTYYEELAEEFGYKKDASTDTDKTYYYKDFADKSIRVISLDPYEKALIRNNYGCFSQEQINWFIQTLISTPNGYGVVCILHSPEAYPNNIVSLEAIEGKDDFFADNALSYWSTPNGINGTPLRDIVDAFISRTTISSSFTQTNDNNQQETITISGDFTSVDSSVEFIAWVCGHQHIDLIGQYKNTANKQIVLNSVCTLSHYGGAAYPYMANLCDIPRGSVGKVQDAFNVYVIDRTRKVIKIARVGSNISETGEERNFMELSYV